MAFIIITTDNNSFSWYYQDLKPKFQDILPTEKIIMLLQASGDELGLINKKFLNVPSCYGACTWRGDMAQFIYDNL